MAFGSISVLLFPADVAFPSHILGGYTHVAITEGIGKHANHHVDHLRIAQPLAFAQGRKEIAATAHALRAPCHDAVGIAKHDRLRRGDNRLQAGAAQSVQGEAGNLLRNAGVQGSDAREIDISRLSLKDISHHDMADTGRLHPGPLHGGLDDDRPQSGCGDSLEGLPKGTDRGALGGNEDDMGCHINGS